MSVRGAGCAPTRASRAGRAAALTCGLVALLAAGCLRDYDHPDNTGRLGGQVLLSGPVRGATVVVDQLNRHTGAIYQHVGDGVTDAEGRFDVGETHEANGVFRIVTTGGTFEDLATGETIVLDDDATLETLIWFPILGLRSDAIVSPVSHLVATLTWAKFGQTGDLEPAFNDARHALHTHFGNADWSLLALSDLAQPQTSPTEPVRAAFVHAALSYLVKDIAAASGASAQQINIYHLVQEWAADLRGNGAADVGLFDGNDGDDRAPGSGLQLGACDPPDASACGDAPADCAIGYCRALCDLYVGTPRGLLAGALTKVILDSGPGGVNQTGLQIADLLGVVRAIAGNTDAALFRNACTETLDRTPPEIRWDEAASPPADALVRGVVSVKALAFDDLDARPATQIVGYVDEDGDPTNSVALAAIDTRTGADGTLTITATATDRVGNRSTAERRIVVDNTPPAVTLSPAGFFVDGATWWTASAAPTLSGTITDAHPAAIKAIVPGRGEVVGELAGAAWSIAFPAGLLDPAGQAVTIVATDGAGNESTTTQQLRPDLDAPALGFEPSAVLDEAAEVVTFGADHAPVHAHFGAPVDLTATTCPEITKFAYLLRATVPPYAIENPGPNPIRYQLLASDPGVGIPANATQYRVGRRNGTTTTWILDWTPTGTGVPVGPGTTRYAVGIFADLVAGLATTEGTYDVQFRATDRLARTTAAARCFALKLRAAPLEFEAAGASPTKAHAYALDALSLAPGAPYDAIAARLLNDDATGASIIDQDVFNATTETIYVTVSVTRPTLATATMSFQLRNAVTNVVPATCGEDCAPPVVQGPVYTSPSPITTLESNLNFPAKVFEVVGGAPTSEIPCLAPCSATGTVFRFAIPPRVVGQPPRLFRIMTMVGRVSGLWPQDTTHPALPPFVDDELTWMNTLGTVTTTTRLTGIVDRSVDPRRTGCVHSVAGSCLREGTLVPYRAIKAVGLSFSSAVFTNYAMAPAIGAQARDSAPQSSRVRTDSWATSEGTLP